MASVETRTLLALVLTTAVLCLSLTAFAGEGPAILPNAHAHNDYEHDRPLLDALDHGFCSIEADVHLVDGQLLVAHDREDVKPARTLQTLYLEPLRERVTKHGGKVYPGGPTVTLLVDLKSAGEPTYAVLRRVLAEYKDMLTEYRDDSVREKAVRVVISGSSPRKSLAAEAVRWAAIDGRPGDFDLKTPCELVPLVSTRWADHFQWRGRGAMPRAERKALRAMVEKAHAQGYRLRFWATADRPEVWDELLAAKVDLIGADNLGRLRDYLIEKGETYKAR